MAKTIGMALRAAREAQGLSLRALEKAVGMPASQISQIETGVRKDPNFTTVARLARHLGVSLDAFVGLTTSQNRGAPPRTLDALRRARRDLDSVGVRLDASIRTLEAGSSAVVSRRQKP